ncbi:MAG: hypothetical protein QXL47_02525 [Candidatus Anstonellales archaeon]
MRFKNLLVALLLFGIVFGEFGISLNPTGTIEDEELESINGIFYANGKLYILSPDHAGYFVYNLETKDMDKKTYEELSGLRDIYVDEKGYMYFTKFGSIWKRAPSLRQIRGYDGAYGIWKLGDLFYITDDKENRIVVMDENGATVNFVGRKGEYNLMFDSPKGIFYDEGKFYVADYNNGRVQVIYENLTLADMCGQKNINMQSAYDVFVDADYVYVVDKRAGEIVWFTKDCYPVFSYAIQDPVGVWVVNNTLFIAQENGKIQRFNYERMTPLQYIFLQVREYMDGIDYYEKLYYIGKEIGVKGEWNILAYYQAMQAKYEENRPGEAYFYLNQLKSYDLAGETSKLENAISSKLLSLADGRWNENKIVDAVRAKNFEEALELLSAEQPSTQPTNITNEQNITQPVQNITKIPEEVFSEVEKKISNPPPLADYSKAKEYYEKAVEYKKKDPQLAYSYLQSANSLIEEENKKTSVYPLIALLVVVLAGFVFFFLQQRKKKWRY